MSTRSTEFSGGPGSPGDEGHPGAQLLKQLWVPRGEWSQRRVGGVLSDMHKRGRALAQTQRTRWIRNRLFYLGEQHLRVVGRSVQTLAPPERLPKSKRRDTVNLLRRFVDGRVSMMTWKTPPFQVVPGGYSSDKIDAARLATKFVRAKWDEAEWDLTNVFRRLCVAGEIDGLAWMSVTFDPTLDEKVEMTFDLATGQPLMEKDKADAALKMGMAQKRAVRRGDVAFRVVRAGAMSVDPAARDVFTDANWVIETRVEDRAVIEQQAQMPVTELLNKHHEAMDTGISNDPYSSADYGQVSTSDTEGQESTESMKNMVTTHTAFIRPHGEWPYGAHIKWLDIAPTQPFIVEPWDEDIPYLPYTPRPHAGLFIKSRGVVDDLIPVQERFNRTITQLGEWLDRAARPPLVVPNGSLSNETPQVFNEEGIVITRGTAAAPGFMNVPPEPSGMLSNYLNMLIEWMQRISVQTEATHGEAPGRVDSALGIQQLQEADERQMSIAESELSRAMEWAVSRALRLVEQHYSIPRLINSHGVDSTVEFNAFVGDKLKGATRFHIDGPLLPRSRAAREEQMMKLVQLTGDKIDWTAHLSNVLDGEVQAIANQERSEEEQQRRENADIIALHWMPDIDKKWADFVEMQTMYAKALEKRSREELGMEGITEPRLRYLGIEIPNVEEGDRHMEHIRELDLGKASAEWKHYHPLVKQAWREHRKEHLEQVVANIGAGPPQPIAGPGGGSQGGAPPSQQATRGQSPQPKTAA